MKEIVAFALAEDSPWGDVTSELLIPVDAVLQAAFVARESGVMSGTAVLNEVFSQVDSQCVLSEILPDGESFSAGTTLALVEGPAQSVLRAERIALNFLQRLCGVATTTATYVAAVAHTDARITDTRKTTPGLRQLEKAAVRHGGGSNHRFSLSDAVLVKDNHIAVNGMDAIAEVRLDAPHILHWEIEVDDVSQIDAALSAGADTILCDNFNVNDLQTAVLHIGEQAFVNASGGVTLDTVAEIAETGVDLISVGALTYSVRAIDIGLDFLK